jgi:hypothetical protein
MVLLGIMVSQSMFLLVGGVADVDERLVESKLLEWFRSSVVPWCSDRDRLLLVCGGFDCCMFAKDGGRSGWGRMALALDSVLKRLGGLLRPIFLTGLDPLSRGWWLSQLVNASRPRASSAPNNGPISDALFLRQR